MSRVKTYTYYIIGRAQHNYIRVIVTEAEDPGQTYWLLASVILLIYQYK